MLPLIRLALAVLVLAAPLTAAAYDGPVDKKVFAMPRYRTVGGQTIKNVRVGWESYGTLNAARDNVILVTHFFSGTSHAAGKYKPADAAPGYWDAVIGGGKPIDTDKYFVLSSDTLVNLNAKDPMVTTTGPATVNPDTGKPYAMSFPIVTMRDFVNVQKALLDSLGIKKLHAVIGASMGALQAFEWAAAYPDMVERIVPVIPAAESGAYLIGWANIWSSPIRLDPNWKNGDYYGGPEPTAGLTEALKIVTLHANHYEWAAKAFGRRWAAPDKDPARSWDARYAVEEAIEKAGAARARVSDANHFLYLVKANQLFVTGHKGSLEDGLRDIKARVLLLPAAGDLLLFPDYARQAMDVLRRHGKEVAYQELLGDRGHLDGVLSLGQAGEVIRAFLAR